MYRLKNILARNNSKKREALRCAFSMVIQVRDAVSALQTRAGLSASFSMAISAISTSSRGRMRGSISTCVTFEPDRKSVV